jgi:hypothetical protein
VKRSTFAVVALFALLILASMFAPAPVTRDVEASKRDACPGLRTAYSACSKTDPDGSRCVAVREQLIAHSCLGSSSGGPIGGSGGF